MIKKSKKNSSGFTLIEVIIYIALFSIVIGGGMVATYEIIQSTDAGTNQVILQEEANFLLRKIDWALTGANTVNAIASPPSLSITKTGLPTLLFDLNSSNLRLTRESGPAIILNSSDIKVSNLSFTNTVTANFTLTTIQNGRSVSENFSTTKYLRK